MYLQNPNNQNVRYSNGVVFLQILNMNLQNPKGLVIYLVNEKKYVKNSNFRNLKCEFQKSDYEKNLCQKLAQFCHIMGGV